MSSTPPDELISAYYDGEVTSEEKTVVEEYLKKSPEADQELKEIGLISELVQDSPEDSEKAPVEFRSAVLKQIERESLLSAINPPLNKWKKIYSYAIALTTAACLFLMIQFFPSADQSANIDMFDSVSQSAGESKPQSGIIRPAEKEESSTASSDKKLASSRSVASSNLSGIASSSSGKGLGSKNDLSGKDNNSLANLPKVSKQPSAPPIVTASLEQNRLNVITLTVSNRKKSLEQLEDLLARQNIPQNPNQSASTESLAGSDKNHDLLAVYVEASETQISTAIEKLQSAPLVLSCSIEPNTKTRNLGTRFDSYFTQENGELNSASKGVRKKLLSSGSKQETNAETSRLKTKQSPQDDDKDQPIKKLKPAKSEPAPPLSKSKEKSEEVEEQAKTLPSSKKAASKSKGGKDKEGDNETKPAVVDEAVEVEESKELEEIADIDSINLTTQQTRLNLPVDFLSKPKKQKEEDTKSDSKKNNVVNNSDFSDGISELGSTLKPADKQDSKSKSSKSNFGFKMKRKSRLTSGSGGAGGNFGNKRGTQQGQTQNIRTVFVLIEAKPVMRKKAMGTKAFTAPAKKKEIPAGKKVQKKSS